MDEGRLERIDSLHRQIEAELKAEIAGLKAENDRLKAEAEADRLERETACGEPETLPEPHEPDRLLSCSQVAEWLVVSPSRVYQIMRGANSWEYNRVTRKTRLSDLEAWNEKMTARPGTAKRQSLA